MEKSKDISVFDIIGPNMIGPSSSHTAGALRIASLAKKMVKNPIKHVNFKLYGSFATTYKGHGTDRALLGGILGFGTEDYRIKDSFRYASEAGIVYSFEPNTTKAVGHPNTVDIVITDSTNEVTTVTGVSVGGGRAVLKNINGVDIDLSGEYYTVVTKHKDLPGVVAAITNILSSFDINIAFMKLYRENKGSIAYSIIEADQPIQKEVIHEMEALNSILSAYLIEKNH